uniref:Uncharacterized protein n=1 Tax=Podoviridae sp. ct8Lf7 TaxID=2827723 RepID=A0A8S5S1A1_9CAUD|nr:MAG TPA: hypothetical protein [Podoviridae sp. ct8Lf7]
MLIPVFRLALHLVFTDNYYYSLSELSSKLG